MSHLHLAVCDKEFTGNVELRWSRGRRLVTVDGSSVVVPLEFMGFPKFGTSVDDFVSDNVGNIMQRALASCGAHCTMDVALSIGLQAMFLHPTNYRGTVDAIGNGVVIEWTPFYNICLSDKSVLEGRDKVRMSVAMRKTNDKPGVTPHNHYSSFTRYGDSVEDVVCQLSREFPRAYGAVLRTWASGAVSVVERQALSSIGIYGGDVD